jgi:hypothetical protein
LRIDDHVSTENRVPGLIPGNNERARDECVVSAPVGYSARSTCMGSMVVARRAGK